MFYRNDFQVWRPRTKINLKSFVSFTAQKMKFSITDSFSKCDHQNIMCYISMVLYFTCTEEMCNGKLNFLCSVC